MSHPKQTKIAGVKYDLKKKGKKLRLGIAGKQPLKENAAKG